MSKSDAAASVRNSRYADQASEMAGAAKKKTCPFCPPDPMKNKFLNNDKWKHWWVWKNPYSYDFHKYDIMIVPKVHVPQIAKVSAKAFAELASIYQWLKAELKLESMCTVIRSGPLEMTGGTIRHIHIQVHVADKTGPMFATFYKDSWGLMQAFVEFIMALGKLYKIDRSTAESRAKAAANALRGQTEEAKKEIDAIQPSPFAQ